MKNNRKIFISIIIAVAIIMVMGVVAVVLIYNNIIRTEEVYKQEVLAKLMQWEEYKEEMKELELQVIKFQEEKNVKEIIDFYENYRELREKYLSIVNIYQINMKEKVVSIEELRIEVTARLIGARDFKEKLNNIDNIPEPLHKFNDLNIDYLNNEIQIMYYIIGYYDGTDYSNYNDTELIELIEGNLSLLQKIDEELIGVFTEYNIKYLL
jgi:hypothetical protein